MTIQTSKLVCDICGLDDVQVHGWVDANTNEYKGETENDTAWCNYCESETTLTLVIEEEEEISK